MFLQRIDLPQWTPYHEECFRVLEQSREYVTDEILLHLVRIQLIKNKASSIHWTEPSVQASISSKLRQDFYLNTLDSQIQDIKYSLPEHLKANRMLRDHV